MNRKTAWIALVLLASVSTAYADDYDLRDYGLVSPVKNQQACGSCWAFGSMASVESNLLVNGNWLDAGVPDMSENHLNHWHGFDPIPPCMGGDYRMVAAYLSRGSGPVLEVDDPYPPNGAIPGDEIQSVYYTVRDIEWYTMDAQFNGIDDIKNAVTTHGVVSTSLSWQSSFYSSGNFYQPDDTPYEPNHSVAIVGWDDAYTMPAAPGPGAWICKNSWGSGWNGDGYFRVSYYDKHAAKNPEMGAVSFHNVVAGTPDDIYDYDYHGWCDEISYTHAFNAYTARKTEHIRSVAFYTTAPGVSYTIRVYDTFAAGQLGGLLVTRSGTAQFTGYHTVDLDELLEITEGDDFYIAIELSNGEQAIECTIVKSVLMGEDPVGGGYTVVSESNPGESYCSTDGTTWTDVYSLNSSANACIKALAIELEAGDSNGDRLVDGTDLAVWQQNYDPLGLNVGNTFIMGDWNRDGLINGGDLALWQQNYDPVGTGSSGVSAVPEPATVGLVLVGAVVLFTRRRR